MWVDLNVDDDQFLRNLRIVFTRQQASESQETLLESFVQDLSFWGSLPHVKESGQYKNGLSNSRRRSRSNLPQKEGMDNTTQELGTKWKAAVDPATGRVYYYDRNTRQTQWEKPPEVRAYEKQLKAERRRRDKIFFREMEYNLRASLERGELVPGIPRQEIQPPGPPLEPLTPPTPTPSNRIRTISGMDDSLLAELRDDGSTKFKPPLVSQRQPNASTISPTKTLTPDMLSGRPPLPGRPRPSRNDDSNNEESFELSPDEPTKDHKGLLYNHSNEKSRPIGRVDSSDLVGEKLLDAPIHQTECDMGELQQERRSPPNGGHMRRNTGGTIYMKNTMTNPDIRATIKCVCGVYRAHILQSTNRESNFNGDAGAAAAVLGTPVNAEVFYDKPRGTRMPSLGDVLAFYDAFYNRSKMDYDTIICSLIYVERLIKATNGLITPAPENWRSILFACMVMASKVWDDLSMWNADFSHVSAATVGMSSFTLKRINQLELALLKSLSFDVKVPANEYAKYYFLIRSMQIRSGLVNEGATPLRQTEVEKMTSRYQDTKLRSYRRDRRTKSMDDSFLKFLVGGEEAKGPVFCLEQLVG